MLSALEGANGHNLVSPRIPRGCVGTGAGQLHLAAFAPCTPSCGPVSTDEHENRALVSAGVCSFLNEKRFKWEEMMQYECLKDASPKEKESRRDQV